MGVNLREIISKKEIDYSYLNGKKLAVDAYNQLYQFITTIRSRDGTPLKDSKGRVTSHLTGVFTRSLALMDKGINLCYVFDGKVPDLKFQEIERRKSVKQEAEKLYEKAKEEGDEDEMRKYASRFSRLTPEMVGEAKALISCLGMPVVQAPSEGEAQASYMTKRKDIYSVSSQDFDSLLFGAERLVRNLSISQKKKVAGKLIFQSVKPEEIVLQENLKNLGISREQLIALAMIIGTDYNPRGIPGLGPKKALNLVKKHKDVSIIFKEVEWEKHFGVEWKEVFDLFVNMKVTDDYEISWKPVDKDKVIKMLVDEHDFSLERVESLLGKAKDHGSQQGLGKWF